MDVEYVTYARVARDASPPGVAILRPREGLDDFLFGHLRAMRSLADEDRSPLATFIDSAPRTLFERLRAGSEAQFLDAAHQLTLRLISEMKGNTTPGLLLCMRIEDGGETYGAALKLQVVHPNSAILQQLDSGEEVLAAVKKVMDSPGELQKGAVVVDPRSGSDVIVGDKLDVAAQYFPRAFGIRVQQTARDAAVDLVAVVTAKDRTVGRRVAEALPRLDAGNLDDVLEKLGDEVPTFTEDIRRDVAAALQTQTRPVVRVDTKAPLKEIVTADGIKIEGPASAMRNIDWVAKDDGSGFRITIDVTQEPKRQTKR